MSLTHRRRIVCALCVSLTHRRRIVCALCVSLTAFYALRASLVRAEGDKHQWPIEITSDVKVKGVSIGPGKAEECEESTKGMVMLPRARWDEVVKVLQSTLPKEDGTPGAARPDDYRHVATRGDSVLYGKQWQEGDILYSEPGRLYSWAEVEAALEAKYGRVIAPPKRGE